MADNIRSIPNLIDGLKPGQRNVLFSCFKRNLKEEIKVAQLCRLCFRAVSVSSFEHSFCSTIVNLAQDSSGVDFKEGRMLPALVTFSPLFPPGETYIQ